MAGAPTGDAPPVGACSVFRRRSTWIWQATLVGVMASVVIVLVGP